MGLLTLAERVGRRVLIAKGIESRWVETKIARHHVYDAKGRGNLPTVVVLHGISSAATPFAPVITRLLPHVKRVLAPEAPGHGFSDPPRSTFSTERLFDAMLELLDREIQDPAILFGNSLGGGVALSYALERPGRVRGLFLASPAGARMDDERFERFLTSFDMRDSGDAKRFLGRLYHKQPWFMPLLASDVKRLFERDAVRSIRKTATTDDLFTSEELRKLPMPIHLVWGKSERLMPPENLEFFKASLPEHAVIEEPEGFGHCAHLDAPAALASRIVEFARRV